MKKIFSAGAIILIGVVISLFNHWEPGGETWGYWFFARIFAETGRFLILDRSPLYTLYLNLFRWLGYPASVTAEYIVTSCIVIFSLTVLFRRYLGLGLAVFVSLLWLPFLQIAEPPVQKLALACSCLAIVVRSTNRNKFYFVLSYALLGLAYAFRFTYVLMILVFAIWDIVKLIKHKGVRSLVSLLRPRLNYWPVLIVLALFIFFPLRQSVHPWNNVYFASTKWFPDQGKTQLTGSFVRHEESSQIKDVYFSTQKSFGGATTLTGMIMANPKLIAKLLLKNIKSLIPVAVSPTDIYRIYLRLPLRGYFMEPLGFLLAVLLLIIIINGAFRLGKDEATVLFIVANCALIGVTVLSLPKYRYTVPFIPVLTLSAYWYGVKLRHRIIKWSEFFASKTLKRWFALLGFLCLPALIIVFSNGTSNWLHLTTGLAGDLVRKEARILQAPNYIKGSFTQVNRLTQGCKGIMAFEHTFIGAFTVIPLDKVYDVWEIPPFGQLDNSVYSGLTTERVDCLLISNELKSGGGFANNQQVRYQDYIKPYVEKLRNLGAHTYELAKFGEMVTLNASGKTGEIRSNK